MKKIHPLILSVLTGLLLFAAWPVSPFTFLVFFAVIPLLWLERQGIRRKKFFGWVYLSMLTWNSATTWWIWNATAPGAIGAILANSLLMCLPWLGFHFIKKRMGDATGYISLVLLWLSFEYIHLQNWGLSWPWLTLGNVFATHTGWIQWYEYTGTSGGSLWILIVNILIFQLAWKKLKGGPFDRRLVVYSLVALLFPFIISFAIPRISQPATVATDHHNIVIVQPNIDPYEKISEGSFGAQLQKLIGLSEPAIDSNTVLVVWPETALFTESGIDEARMRDNPSLSALWNFLRRHPTVNLLTGVESYRIFKDMHSGSARRISDTDKYFESYNAAVLLDSTGATGFYHKSMLVPGVETLPSFLHFLDSWFEQLGGTTSGYTGQDMRSVLETTNHSYHIAPAVCYESIYGEFMSRYIRNGADIIAIITNDGWWGDTPGYRQHEQYARLRAIETRRWVIRSANTGVSCIVDPAGNITESSPWLREAVIRQTVPATTEWTFYARFGDCISKLALALTGLLLVWSVIKTIRSAFRS